MAPVSTECRTDGCIGVISGLLTACFVSIPHAPGWSEPVVSIEHPIYYSDEKVVIATYGNCIHQIWAGYQSETRIGHNVVLPDGTIILPDTMLSRDVWSAHPGAFLISPDSVATFWREVTPVWNAYLSNIGSLLMPPALLFDEPWSGGSMHSVQGSHDSEGRLHLIRLGSPWGELWYSVVTPGGSELWRDTIPGLTNRGLIAVDGNRVHIKFDGMDQLADYIQYDLSGSIVIPPMDLVVNQPPIAGNSRECSMCLDPSGDPMLVIRVAYSGSPVQLKFYKIDADTGTKLVDGAVLFTSTGGLDMLDPFILSGPDGSHYYVIWLQDDATGFKRLVMCMVIDAAGDILEEPYIAYDYSDDPYDIQGLAADVNELGDIFLIWSASIISPPEPIILLGWFDHNWLGVEDDSTGADEPPLALSSSCNPFSSSVTVTSEGPSLPGQLMVYDITGRLIRSLSDRQGSSFLWDGRDGSGSEIPTGTYLIQGAVDGQVTSIRVVKL
jgi:hypothetical protein